VNNSIDLSKDMKSMGWT